MQRRDFPSEAAYLRAHREAFELALQLGITPREAGEKIRRRKASERDEQLSRKIEELKATARATEAAHDPAPMPCRSFENFDAPHMMRN